MFNKTVSEFIRVFCMIAVFAIIAFMVMGLVIFVAGTELSILYKIALLAAVVLLIWIVYKSLNKECKWIWIVLIGIGIVARVVYAVAIEPSITADALTCLDAAKSSLQRDFSWANQEYFQAWAFQIPLVLYEAVILKIFGAVRALYIFNGIFSILNCFMIFLIVNKVYGKNTALITTAIYSCFPEHIFRISILYNFIIAGFFFLVAIYFFISICQSCNKKETDVRKVLFLCIISGLFFGISNLFRTEAVIGLLGAECWFIYFFISKYKNESTRVLLLHTVLYMLTLYAVFKAVNLIVDYSVIHAGISPNGIKNNCPYWYIVCGLTPDNYGIYNPKYYYISQIRDKDEQFLAFKNIMHEIFSGQSVKDILIFFINKAYYMWGEVYYFGITAQMSGLLRAIIHIFNQCIYLLMFLLAAFGLKKKQFNSIVSYIAIIVLGFFLVYVLKEINIKYRYFAYLTVTILASSGINYFRSKKRADVSRD